MRIIWYTTLSFCLIFGAIFAVGFGPTAEETNAFSSFPGTWSSVYPNSDSLSNANQCQLCHLNASGGNGWNAYGWDVRQQIVDQNLSIADAINAVEALDSDGNSIPNRNEITTNAQPGWRQSATNSVYFKDGTIQMNQSAPTAISGVLDAGTATFPSPRTIIRLPLIEKAQE